MLDDGSKDFVLDYPKRSGLKSEPKKGQDKCYGVSREPSIFCVKRVNGPGLCVEPGVLPSTKG